VDSFGGGERCEQRPMLKIGDRLSDALVAGALFQSD